MCAKHGLYAKARINDTYLRLGDSHFVTSDYASAIKEYDKAIAMKGIDKQAKY